MKCICKVLGISPPTVETLD